MSESTPTPVEAAIAEESATTPESNTAPEASKSNAAASSKDISYEDWLAKENASESTPEASNKGQSVEEYIAGLEAATAPKEEQAESKTEELKKEIEQPSKVKIGDKEYTTEELSAKLSQVDEVSAKHKELQSQLDNIIEVLKADPGQVLGQLGSSKEALEEWYYKTHIEPTLLSPEERQAKADKEELESYRMEKQKTKETEEQKAKEAQMTQAKADWSKRIETAMESTKLPRTQYTISQVAKYLKEAYAAGNKDVRAEDVVTQVKKDWLDTQKELSKTTTIEELAESLGKETLDKLRALDVAKYKQTAFENKGTQVGKVREAKKSDVKKKYTSIYDMVDDL